MASETLAPETLAVSAPAPYDAPAVASFTGDTRNYLVPDIESPLVEPIGTFIARADEVAALPLPGGGIGDILFPPTPPLWIGQRSLAQWNRGFRVGQGARGTCWAFAGCAALEAAYARAGVTIDLSPHYLYSIVKAHENHRNNGGIHSLTGFGGNSYVVQHLNRIPVASAADVPYIDQGPLLQLSNAIPGTGMALGGSTSGTLEQADWFEFDLRNVPLAGRWGARYWVQGFGVLSNFDNDDIKEVIRRGHEVVVDTNDKVNGGGHTMLIYGYNDGTGTFEIKNSQQAPGLGTMLYTNDPQFDIIYNTAHYVTAVGPVRTSAASAWVGRWETNYDGVRGRLVIRRFSDLFGESSIPTPTTRISLGTWYGDDGRILDVVGHFADLGRGLMCTIGGQDFELWLHASDWYRAGGRFWVNSRPRGVSLSRGTAMGAGAGPGTARVLWDMKQDGDDGTLYLSSTAPRYTQALNLVDRRVVIDKVALPHVDLHMSFDAVERPFDLDVHTQESGVFGGVYMRGDGQNAPAFGRMSRNLYTVASDGQLRHYRHIDRATFGQEWEGPRVAGTGWTSYGNVFGGGDGVVYGIEPQGRLLWHFHTGRLNGAPEWEGPREVGTGWQNFHAVFAGDGGVVYAITTEGVLLWYRHIGRRNGDADWLGPVEVGTGWQSFKALTAGPDGAVYGITQAGNLLWYRHEGHDQGYPIWKSPTTVGTGWDGYDAIWAVGNGYFYGRANNGDLRLWRHHGYQSGSGAWSGGVRVGTGWSGFHSVFAT